LFRGSYEEADAPATVEDALVPSTRSKSATAADLLSDVRPSIVDANLQCVPFARDASGVDIRGNANKWWKLAAGKYTRASRPQEGSVFVMRGYKTVQRGHVAVVRQILDDRTIVVDHANWGNDGRIYLSAPIRDESKKNDWSKVRVWYTPTNQWGRRLYRAKGFIYPTTSVAHSGSFALGSN
jgi:surface antigen